jgi:serine/threonine protein kinase
MAPLQQLGDYPILREVGRGGIAVVYEAQQLSLGRHVAIKVLVSDALLDPRHLGRFQREARSVPIPASLQQPRRQRSQAGVIRLFAGEGKKNPRGKKRAHRPYDGQIHTETLLTSHRGSMPCRRTPRFYANCSA